MDQDYFELRNIQQEAYLDYSPPTYLLRLLKNKNARILDFGCGFGQLIQSLNKLGYHNVEGADINPVALDFLRASNIITYDLRYEQDFYCSHEGLFDFIVMSHVLEHIPKNEIINQLRLIRKLINMGGSLIVMVPNAQSNTGCYWAYEDFTHELLFTAGSLFYVLKSAGFSDISFIDQDCTSEVKSNLMRLIRRCLLYIYRCNYNFWNKVTGSAFHDPSPKIFSYEIKALARH